MKCLKKTDYFYNALKRFVASLNSVAMEINDVCKKLDEYAPADLAESWDNTGLLVEPTQPCNVTAMLLTIDLTEEVLSEAIDKKVNMILAYHPPIFQSLKKLTQKSWKERILIKCLEERIAVYSPHTRYDALKNGINDWLIAPFGKYFVPLDTELLLTPLFEECVGRPGGVESSKG